MSILSRFKEIIASNLNALLDKAEDPEKMIEQYLKELTGDLATVKRETASVMADEAKAKRNLVANQEEIEKYTDLMNKAKASIDDETRRQYLYEAQEVFMDLLPLYHVYNADNVAAMDKDLVMTANAYVRYKQAYYVKGE